MEGRINARYRESIGRSFEGRKTKPLKTITPGR
jgi:hypothetical protein